MKYPWIKEHCDEYSVVRLCLAMRVSTSGFCRWLGSEPSLRSKRTAAIHESVLAVYHQSKGIYGSYKISEKLKTRTTWKLEDTIQIGRMGRIKKLFGLMILSLYATISLL